MKFLKKILGGGKKPAKKATVAKPKITHAKKKSIFAVAKKKTTLKKPTTQAKKSKQNISLQSKSKIAKKTQKRTAKKTVKKTTKKTVKKTIRKSSLKKKAQANKIIPKKKSTAKEKNNKKETESKQKPRRVLKQEFIQRFVTQETQEGITQEQERKIRTYPIVKGGESERVKSAITILKEFVRKKIITDWRINLNHSRSANLYMSLGLAIENEMQGIREEVVVTVYKRLPDGMMGEIQIPILSAESEDIRALIMDAANNCPSVKKKAFKLPVPSDAITFPQSHDEKMLEAMWSGLGLETPRKIQTQMKELLAPMKDITSNAAEILTSANTLRIVNSNGVDVSFHKTVIYIELVLSCKGKSEESEFHWSTIATSPEQINLIDAIPRQSQIVRDAVIAEQSKGFQGNVLLSRQSLAEFFTPDMGGQNPLVLHTFARVALMGISRLKPGEQIGKFSGEPFSVSSNPSLPLGLFSAPVDEEGTPLSTVESIRNGVFHHYIASARYGQHLGVPVTGNMSNLHIGDGATREEHLRGNNYIEILAFSWFNPDPFSGDFSAEIRLGYVWINGRKTPFKGGHFVGNVFKNLLNARFSRESMQEGRYYGPRAVLFKDATITKKE